MRAFCRACPLTISTVVCFCTGCLLAWGVHAAQPQPAKNPPSSVKKSPAPPANKNVAEPTKKTEPQVAKQTERPFRDGPLVVEDFRGTPPTAGNGQRTGQDFSAYVETVVRWNIRYRFDQEKIDRFVLKLIDVDVYSAILPDQSFNTQRHNRDLLDHEQGHFDIAEIFTLEQEIRILEKIKSDQPPTATGTSEKAAADKLNAEVAQWLEAERGTLRVRQQEYDRVTNHGQVRVAQQQQRTEHAARLKLLQDKAASLRSQKTK